MAFAPGDHLRVRRPLGYFHHGIYVGDSQVVQFGGGIFDKPGAFIGIAPLEAFAKRGAVEVVPYLDRDPAMAVRRAMWLRECPPIRSYSLIGFNCEHVARWCATGWETESHQTRGVFLAKAAVGGPLLWSMAWHARTNRPLPGARLLVAYEIASAWMNFEYHNEIRHFNKHIREHWPPAA